MSSEFELKSVYRRIDHLLKFSSRTVWAAFGVGLLCAGLYFRSFGTPPEDLGNTWMPSGVFWLGVGCYCFGVATLYFLIRKLKGIVESSKETWGQKTTD